MKILHCCLSCFYIDKYNYQENMLPRQNKLDGHEVLIVASTETYVDNKTLGYVESGEYLNEDGIKVIRVPYKRVISEKISHKFRAYKGVLQIIEKFSPDVILFHGIGAWELLTVAKFSGDHKTILYVDNHSSYLNSAQSPGSFYLLHKCFYRYIVKKALPAVERFFYIGFGEKKFATEMYRIPEERQEYFPLGGNVMNYQEYSSRRCKVREKYGVLEDEILFVHSGKMNKAKRTLELVTAFRKVEDDKFHFFIAGSFMDEIENAVMELIKDDKRMEYLGWQLGEELLDLLCGADVYLQPGTASATLQNAMCCGCAIMSQPFEDYKYLLADAGLYVMNEEDIKKAFEEISINKEMVKKLKEKTFNRAKEILDYRKLATRLYEKTNDK